MVAMCTALILSPETEEEQPTATSLGGGCHTPHPLALSATHAVCAQVEPNACLDVTRMFFGL